MKINLIMLAAGNSRRFGSNKLLYEVEGAPMYARILQILAGVRENICREGLLDAEILVVTQYEEIADAARGLGAEVRYNLHPEQGISSSLKIGLAASESADACLFAVSDQPWLKPETIEGLVRLFVSSSRGIACVSHGGEPGNPCVFSRKYYPDLMALSGDAGGKRIVKAHLSDTAMLEILDAAELLDIDRDSDIF